MCQLVHHLICNYSLYVCVCVCFIIIYCNYYTYYSGNCCKDEMARTKDVQVCARKIEGAVERYG